jgi:iron complex outermembrane receptor protein
VTKLLPSTPAVRAALPLLAALASAAAPAAAQARPDTVLPRAQDTVPVRVDGLVVVTSRPAGVVGGAGAVVLAVDSLRVPPAPRLAEVLRETPFVRVRTNSRGETELSLRGSESRQVAVLVDGVPLTLGWDDRADLSVVPATGAQGIRVVRGVPSLLHGPNVLGGVVEVGVARAAGAGVERESLRAPAAADHAGGRMLSAAFTAPLGGAGATTLRAGAGFRDQPGFALAGGVVDPGEDDGLRGNSDAESLDGFLALRHRTEGGAWASLSGFGSRTRRGVTPELHLESPRFWRYPEASRGVAALSAGTGQRTTPLGEGDLEATFGFDAARTELASYADRAYDEVTGREDADDRTLSLRLLGDHTLGGAADLRAALTLADTRRDEVLEPGGANRYRQRLWSLGAEAERRVLLGGPAEVLRLVAGASADGADTPEAGDKEPLGRLRDWGARLGATATLGGAAELHAGLSRRSRFPALRELYSGALGRFQPNPDLHPETLLAAEAGATAQLGALQLQAVGFHQRLEDAIVRVGLGGGRFRRENRNEIRSTGAELLADWRAGPRALTGSLTLQRVRLIDPEAEGSGRAEYQPGVTGSLDGSTPLLLGLQGEAGVSFQGRQWCVHPELGREVALDASARTDLRLSRAWRAGPLARRLRAVLALDNAADAAVYDQCGLPQPGRTLRLELRVE